MADVKGCPLTEFDKPCYKDICPWAVMKDGQKYCMLAVAACGLHKEYRPTPL